MVKKESTSSKPEVQCQTKTYGECRKDCFAPCQQRQSSKDILFGVLLGILLMLVLGFMGSRTMYPLETSIYHDPMEIKQGIHALGVEQTEIPLDVKAKLLDNGKNIN